MGKFIHFVRQTIFYDKKQSAAIFLSIVISASLLSGIGTLLHCGVEQNYEKRKEIYGDWHAVVYMNLEEAVQIKEESKYSNQAGICRIVNQEDKSEELTYEYLDDQCREMLGRQVVEGAYPTDKTEVALDRYTITNLGLSDVIGDEVNIMNQSFTLSGIIENQKKSGIDEMQIFVSHDYQSDNAQTVLLYLKFEGKDVYRQISNFVKTYRIDNNTVKINDEIVDYVGGISFTELTEIVNEGLRMPEGKAAFILGTLRERCHLLERGILLAIGFFCAFVIYSIFQISTMKRIPQFGTMYAIGIEKRYIFLILFGELFLLFVVGYPLGCMTGILIVKALFNKIGNIFVNQQIGNMQNGVHVSQSDQFLLYSSRSQSSFSVSVTEILLGAVLMLILLTVISILLMSRVEKMTVVQAMKNQNASRKRNRKIYAQTKQYLPDVLTRKFIFENKTSSTAIIMSIAIGGIIFLSGSFIIYNTKINNELSLKTDDGLGSDMQIYEDSQELSDVIGKDVIENIAQIPGVKIIDAVSYTLGEVCFEKEKVIWDSYIAELADDPSWLPDEEVMEKYNGAGLRDENGDYRLKTNVYGYDENMLEALKEYVIEGNIDFSSMNQDNSIILKTWIDGQGNTDGIDVHPGDTIALKVPKSDSRDSEILKFIGDDSEYTEKEYVISAVVSRPMAKNTCYIGDDGMNSLDIIMTNEQMESNYGIAGYNMACIQLQNSDIDSQSIADEIANYISGTRKCILKDYTQAIEIHNEYLNQRKWFYLSLTAILLIVSSFYMANSMNFLMHARKYDVGVIRAMGMTEERFILMMAKEASVYGIIADLMMIAIFIPIRNLLFFLMKSVWLYIMPVEACMINEITFITLLNIVICIVAIVIPVRAMLKEDIISEIKI